MQSAGLLCYSLFHLRRRGSGLLTEQVFEKASSQKLKSYDAVARLDTHTGHTSSPFTTHQSNSRRQESKTFIVSFHIHTSVYGGSASDGAPTHKMKLACFIEEVGAARLICPTCATQLQLSSYPEMLSVSRLIIGQERSVWGQLETASM